MAEGAINPKGRNGSGAPGAVRILMREERASAGKILQANGFFDPSGVQVRGERRGYARVTQEKLKILSDDLALFF